MDMHTSKPLSSTTRVSSTSYPSTGVQSTGRNSSGGDGIASSSKMTASTTGPDSKLSVSVAPTVSTPSSTSSPPDTTDTGPARIPTKQELNIILEMIIRQCGDIKEALHPPTVVAPEGDPPCVICDDPADDYSDNIVFCDGCNMAVHQTCYGLPYVPEGDWFCKKCELSPDRPVECVLCLRSLGGAFKVTNRGEWAHVLCAEFVPETAFDNDLTREPIIGTERALQTRGKIKRACAICKVQGGAPIQCAEKKCCVPFHVTCARDRGWLESMAVEGLTVLPDRGDVLLCRGWCDKHIPALLVETYENKHKSADKAAKARRKASGSGDDGLDDTVCTEVSRQLEMLSGAINDDLNHVGRSIDSHRVALPLVRPQPPSSTIVNPLKRARSIDFSDDSSIGDSSDEDEGGSPAPKRIKSTHTHPADQILDLESQLEGVYTLLRDSKAEVKRLRATDRAKDAEMARKDQAISRLGTTLADLQALQSTSRLTRAASPEEVEEMPFCPMPPFTEVQEAVIDRRIRREVRRYGPAMASLEYHIRMSKHWEKEMERMDGFFKEKIALEKQLKQVTSDHKTSEAAHAEEMDSLLIPYDGAYWAIYSGLSPETKIAKIKAHLREMTALSKALNRSWDEPEAIAEVVKERAPLVPVAVNLPERPSPTPTTRTSTVKSVEPKTSPPAARALQPSKPSTEIAAPSVPVPASVPVRRLPSPVMRRNMRTFDAPMEITLNIKLVFHVGGAEISVTTLTDVNRMDSLQEVFRVFALRHGCAVEDVVLTMANKRVLPTTIIDTLSIWHEADIVGYRKGVYEQVLAERRARVQAEVEALPLVKPGGCVKGRLMEDRRE